MPPPERRRRRDVVVAVGLTVAVAVAWTVLWATSPHHGTISTPAAAAVPPPPSAEAVPAGFTEAWRAASAATPGPVVAGPVVVTGDGDAVAGRDALTGEVRWTYTRDIPLCTVGAGFPDHDGGRALALYRNGTWCSELTSLNPDTGTRDRQRNPDVHPGTRLLDGGSLVTATGPTYLEVFRSDLVRTVEYGDVPTPRQVGRQPRPGCESTGFAATSGRVAVLQRCPNEATDRLTVLIPDGAEADKPQEEFSVPLPASNATLVAVSEDRVAVALPDPPRLEVLDRSGAQVGLVGLDVPARGRRPAPRDRRSRRHRRRRPRVLVDGVAHGRARRPGPHAQLDPPRHPRARPSTTRTGCWCRSRPASRSSRPPRGEPSRPCPSTAPTPAPG